MSQQKKKKILYGIALVMLILMLILMKVRLNQTEEVFSIPSETTQSSKPITKVTKERTSETEPLVKDNRSAEEVAIHFVQSVFSYSKDSVKEATSDVVSDLNQALEMEVKGKKAQEISNVKVTSYQPVESSKHVIVSYDVTRKDIIETEEVFLILMEMDNGFKVIDYTIDTHHSD